MSRLKKRLISRRAITQAQTIAIAVIIIIAVVAAAWYATRPAPTPTPTPTPTPKPTPTPTPKPTPTPTPKPTPTPTPPAEKILIASVVGTMYYTEPWGPDPHFYGCGYMPDLPLICEKLVAYDPVALQKGEYEIIPWLAKSYSISEDGLTYTIDIRKGVTFHGTGDEMDIEDVVWSLERVFLYEFPPDLVMENPCRYGVMPESIEKIDDDTVVIHLPAPYPAFLGGLAAPWSVIMDKDAMMAHAITGKDGKSDLGFTWLNNVPEPGKDPFTGPYTIGRWDLTERYEDVRFEDWWGGPPEYGLTNKNVDRMIWVVINEDLDARFKLERKDVDFVADLQPTTWYAFKERAGYKTYTTPSVASFSLDMHSLIGPLQDWRVRKAVKMTLNYTAITQDIMLGTASIAQLAAPYQVAWTPEVGLYYGDGMDPDIEGAKALLAEAGYPNGFHLDIYARPEPRFGMDFTDFGLQIQSDLAKIGIDCTLQIYKVSQFYATKHDPTLEGAWIQPENYVTPDEPIRFLDDLLGWPYTGEEPGQAVTRDQYLGFNQTSQGDTFDFDWYYETYDKAIKTADVDERALVWQELLEYYLERGPCVRLALNNERVVYTDRLKGPFVWTFSDQLWPLVLLPDFELE